MKTEEIVGKFIGIMGSLMILAVMKFWDDWLVMSLLVDQMYIFFLANYVSFCIIIALGVTAIGFGFLFLQKDLLPCLLFLLFPFILLISKEINSFEFIGGIAVLSLLIFLIPIVGKLSSALLEILKEFFKE